MWTHEKQLEAMRDWRKRNREKVRAYNAAYLQKHGPPEYTRERWRQWYKRAFAANPEKYRKRNRENQKKWAAANPEKMKEKWRRQTARKPWRHLRPCFCGGRRSNTAVMCRECFNIAQAVIGGHKGAPNAAQATKIIKGLTQIQRREFEWLRQAMAKNRAIQRQIQRLQ